MTREQISELVSGADSNYVEEAKTVKRLYSPKKLFIIGIVATFTLLSVGWTGAVVVKQLVLGQTYTATTSNSGGLFPDTVSITIGSDEDIDIFEEIDGELYFTFDGNYQNITEYCSIEDYFAYENIDENGNGYVIVVGGIEGKRGYYSYNYENGKTFAGGGAYHDDEDGRTPIWYAKADKTYEYEFNN